MITRLDAVLCALVFTARRLARVFAAVLLAFLFATSGLHAQSNAEGALFGRVSGFTPAELAGATVKIESKNTGLAREAILTGAGTFNFSALPVGDYTVTLSLRERDPLTQDAHVSLATTTSLRFEGSGETLKLGKFVVQASNVSPVDVATTEIGLNVRSETITMLPVARDITAVAMLTPGVSRGDGYFNNFGNLSSFAGASVAENAYYLNGFNITDFRRGLGYGTVPFEFFQEFQVMTSGYSTEFGRSTGGVVNAISKRGSNQFKAAVNVYWEPKKLAAHGFDSYRSNGQLYLVRSIGSAESRNYNVEVSGPIFKNRLFFYALYQGRDVKDDFMSGTNQWHFRESNDPFWAAKVDWQANKDHAFEYTTFSDKRTTTTHRFLYPLTSSNFSFTRPPALGADQGNLYADSGGRSHIGRYSGRFSDSVTITALYGESLKDATQRSDVSDKPYIIDQRGTTRVLSGAASVTDDLDRRKATRIDGVYKFQLFGSHALKFGYDKENNLSHSISQNSGGIAYNYFTYNGDVLPNGAVAPVGTKEIATKVRYFAGGDFGVLTEATYLEDNWKLYQERLSLNLGARREMFDNRNGNGQSFIQLKNQIAPRLSAAFDVKGDGRSKIFGSWGRYFLQIPTNTNVRLAGGETFYTDYFVLNGVNADSTPILGAQIGNRVVTGNGIVPDTSTIVSTNIKPMYQDEWVIGYERSLGKNWKVGINGIYRDLKTIIEDSAVDTAVIAYAKAKGYDKFQAGGFDYYVLMNPGSNLDFYINLTRDLDGDGVVDANDQKGDRTTKEHVQIPASALGYPKGSRKYYAIELKAERQLVDKWFANFSYVWSQLRGNYEGSVYSDIGQSDAGLTQLFDQPGLVDGTDGYQPNDRRHTFKAWGGYQLTKELTLSANFMAQSGRPISALGLHPTDAFARAYGASSYYVGGKLTPRGSMGRTPWVYNLDVSLHYKPAWGRGKLNFGLDVFNLPNWQKATGLYERAETAAGAPDPRYKSIRTIQTPRYVRLSAGYAF